MILKQKRMDPYYKVDDFYLEELSFYLLANVTKSNEGPKKKPVINNFQICISLKKYSTFSKNIIDAPYSALFKKRQKEVES